MRLRNSPAGKVLFAVLSAFVGISALCAHPHDHSKLPETLGCDACHYSIPQKDTGKSVDFKLKRGASESCLSCHSLTVQKQHPMGVKPKRASGLPLEENEFVSCLTCHSPHVASASAQPYAPRTISPAFDDRYSTYLLNTPNEHGELCKKCHDPSEDVFKVSLHNPKASDNCNYAGSESCRQCHLDIYDQWKLTPHARMTRKFSQLDEGDEVPVKELDYPKERIAWVLGSHYVHRFVAEASGTFVVLPQVWSIGEKKWLSVTDAGWRSRQWLKQCAGCHTTGFSSENDSFAESGVGCEACHGPGKKHIETKSPEQIVSLRSMTERQQEMVCMSCHTSGVDISSRYNFPVGYRPGADLSKFFHGLTPKPGQTFETFYGDETYEDRLRQWDFLKSRLFLANGLTCDYCKNFRNVKTIDNSKFLTHNRYCMTCHADKEDHPEEAPGTECITCHQPMRNLKDNKHSIHDHKFRFD